jgi:hypothetical protein
VEVYGGGKIWLHTFLTSEIYDDEWLTSFFGHFTSGKQLRHRLSRRLDGSRGRLEILEMERRDSIPEPFSP